MKGKVAVFTEPMKEMEFREYPLPEIGAYDILVKVHCANICGSDLHIWRGHGPPLPQNMSIVPGHEMVGEVFRLGKNRSTDCMGQPLEEGDRITYAYFVPCGTCAACLSGSPACPNRYRYWFDDANRSPYFRGAYGEYYYLRRGQTVCRIPAELDDSLVSPANCALCESFYGLDQIGIRLGDAIVIQGAGGLGLYATAIAKDMGAAQVIVVDKLASRLDLAQSFGADITVNRAKIGRKECREIVFEMTRGQGADVVAEFVGVPQVVEEGINLLRPAGRYLWVGNITPGLPSSLDPGTVVRGSQVIQGVIVYEPWVLARAIDFLARRKKVYPFDQVVSHTFAFAEINEAFHFANKTQAIRVSLTM